MTLGPHHFRLTLPAAPDAFLEDAELLAACDRRGVMPYWPLLWPGAEPMARLVAAADWPSRSVPLRSGPTRPGSVGLSALEIGSGIGLVGLTALAAGLDVTFSDGHLSAVELALFNAKQNGWPHAPGLVLDWREPIDRQYDVLLGCEVLYDLADHGPILRLIDRMLAPGGVCWLGDAGRQTVEAFLPRAKGEGFAVELRDAQGRSLNGPRVGEFALFILGRPRT
ncbi:MAG: class I SAM-dependent methyltransferase, partial [Planctomycetaceae bacterium]